METFIDNCVAGITANEQRCRELVENSVGTITALCPHIGYQEAADLAKEAITSSRSIRDLILEKGILNEEQLNKILDPMNMTEPGISGKELMGKEYL